MKGKIIVFEGMDGAGKRTQSEMLFDALNKLNKKVIRISFPNYNIGTGKLIQEYLKNSFYTDRKNMNDVIGMSVIYASNRHQTLYNPFSHELCTEKYPRIIDYYNDGYTIICDRYTTSNILYSVSNFYEKNKEEQCQEIGKEILSLINKIEYDSMKIPKPDLIFFLRITPELSYSNLMKRYKNDISKCDKNENLEYSYNVYNTMKLYKNITNEHVEIINCVNNNSLLSKKEIHKKVCEVINSF